MNSQGRLFNITYITNAVVIFSSFLADYVDDLINLLINEVFLHPTPYTEELRAIPIPPPLSSLFDKPSKEEVIARHVSRFSQGGDGTQHTGQLGQETAGGSEEQHRTG